MKRLLALLALLALVGCGHESATDIRPPPTPVAQRGIPVRFNKEKALYVVDLRVNDTIIRDVMLDTGSSNLIFADYSGTDEPISAPFTAQYGIGGGSVELHLGPVTLGETTQNYPFGVFTSGVSVHNILGLGFDTNVVGPKVPTLVDSFTLNLCRDGESFMELKTTPSNNETAVIPNSFNGNSFDSYSVQPTALLVDGKPIGAFPTQAQGYVTLVDSGTNLFHYLPDSLIYALGQHYKEIVPPAFWNYHNNVTISKAQLEKLGKISVEFPNLHGGTFNVSIPPEGYTATYSDGIHALFASAFPIRSNVKLTILGSLFMTNALISFDKENRKLSFSENGDLCGETQPDPAVMQIFQP